MLSHSIDVGALEAEDVEAPFGSTVGDGREAAPLQQCRIRTVGFTSIRILEGAMQNSRDSFQGVDELDDTIPGIDPFVGVCT